MKKNTLKVDDWGQSAMTFQSGSKEGHWWLANQWLLNGVIRPKRRRWVEKLVKGDWPLHVVEKKFRTINQRIKESEIKKREIWKSEIVKQTKFFFFFLYKIEFLL